MREIGSRLELFVDDWLIERFNGTELRLHQPTWQNVALPFDAPWEGLGCHYITVMQVSDEFRAYYRGHGNGGPACTAVALSKDGIHWERPNLGLYAFDGYRRNNIVLIDPASDTFAPFLDTNPAAPASERFKAVGRRKIGDRRGLVAFVSADGYRWRLWREEPIITDGYFDSQNLAFWNAYRGHYVAFYRDFIGRNMPVTAGIRGIKYAASTDFTHWTAGQWLDYGDKPLEHLYTNATVSYFRAPHLYLAFPKRFLPDRRIVAEHDDNGLSEGVFMSSRDGLHWDRRFMEAFLPPGRAYMNWVDRTNGIAWGLLPTAPDEISLYWVEYYGLPTCRLRRGTLRMDGFASLYAGYEGGEALTHPLTFTGSELVLNYSTSAAGSLRVEVLDATDHVVAASPEIYGDEIEGVVPWQNGATIGHLAGQPVRLRFTLRDADIYALRFR